MFDDQPNQTTPPANLPTEPDDMFAGVDKISAESMPPAAPNALAAGVLKPKSTGSMTPAVDSAVSGGAMPAMYAVKEPVVGKVVLILVLLVVLGGAGYFGYRLYAGGFFSVKDNVAVETPAPPQTPAPVATPPVVEPTTPEPVAPQPLSTTTAEAGVNMASDEILFGQGVDSDKDGLDDVREAEIGTNSTQADSDGDGLSDGDEVIIWKTDPLKPDTDGDGFSDGQEVQNGYNPLGPGKLFNVPTTTAR